MATILEKKSLISFVSNADIEASIANILMNSRVPRREGVTAKQAREAMLAEGIRPEDNSASRELLAMREEN